MVTPRQPASGKPSTAIAANLTPRINTHSHDRKLLPPESARDRQLSQGNIIHAGRLVRATRRATLRINTTACPRYPPKRGVTPRPTDQVRRVNDHGRRPGRPAPARPPQPPRPWRRP